jgi:preprotein translocase subunit SecG
MQALNIFHVLVAIAMVAFILVQRGPGATAGAAFGSGASGTVFGARGAGSFLSRATWVLATLFCLISLVMAVVVSRNLAQPETDLGVMGAPATSTEVVVPATDLPLPLEQDSDVPVMPMAPSGEAADGVPGEDASDVLENPEVGALEEEGDEG